LSFIFIFNFIRLADKYRKIEPQKVDI
jgi:hypothetical protein